MEQSYRLFLSLFGFFWFLDDEAAPCVDVIIESFRVETVFTNSIIMYETLFYFNMFKKRFVKIKICFYLTDVFKEIMTSLIMSDGRWRKPIK